MKKSIYVFIAFTLGAISLYADDQTASVAKVKFNYCFTTYGDWVNVNLGECRLPYLWNGENFSAAGDYSVTLTGQNIRGCDSIARLHLTTYDCLVDEQEMTVFSTQLPVAWEGNSCTEAGTFYSDVFVDPITGKDKYKQLTLNVISVPEGAIGGLFTINSSGTQVMFSQGNLQYQASSGTWRFAAHQYDVIGNAVGNTTPGYNGRGTQSGWIDLFRWGTSGAHPDLPPHWYTSNNKDPLYTSAIGFLDLTGENAIYDWGVYNAIENGGNQAGLWRTLTAEEWYYVANLRPNAADKISYQCIVNGIYGYILLPDTWQLPAGATFYKATSYTSYSYTIDEWNLLGQAGAVFFPAGKQDLNNNFVDNTKSVYWTTTTIHANEWYNCSFSYNLSGWDETKTFAQLISDPQWDSSKYKIIYSVKGYGLPVRLVRVYQ